MKTIVLFQRLMAAFSVLFYFTLTVSAQQEKYLPLGKDQYIEQAKSNMPVSSINAIEPEMLEKEIDLEKVLGVDHPSIVRIVGGEDADIVDYPWQISLQVVNETGAAHICGGTILNENWVITAAHCVEPIAALSFLQVRSGFTSITSDEGTYHRVNSSIIHESYGDEDKAHDLALLKVVTPFDFDDPAVAKLPLVNTFDVDEGIEVPGVVADISGWGALAYHGASPDTLQAAMVEITSVNETAYPHVMITDGMILAGEDGVDACQGDSGGPLVVTNRYGQKKLAGVTSWGVGCGWEGYPGVYTRTSHYESWLDQNLKETDPNQYNIVWHEDFEPADIDGNLPAEWDLKRNTAADGGLNGNNLQSTTFNTWMRNSPLFGLYYEEWGIIDWARYVNSGEASMLINYNAPDFTWAVSPEITIPEDEDVELGFWAWYISIEEEDWNTLFHVNVLTNGQWQTLQSFDDGGFNFMDEEIVLDLSDFAGETIQLAFVYEENNGIHMSIDDVMVRYEKPTYEVSFEVTDGNNTLPDAMLHIPGHEKLVTNQNGLVQALLYEGTYLYQIEKLGYQTVEGEFEVNSHGQEVFLNMEKIPAPEIKVNPIELTLTLEEDQQSTREVIIENTGEQMLEFDLSAYPGNSELGGVSSDLFSTLSENIYSPVELGFDNGVFNGWGGSSPQPFTAAVRFMPEDLEPYYGTHQLAGLKFILIGEAVSDVQVHVWQGTEQGEPGHMIHHEFIDYDDVNIGSWTNFALPDHLELVPGEEYWIGYTLYCHAEGHPMALDRGPGEPGKGGWIFNDNQWMELSELGFSLNWCLRGLLEPKVGLPWLSLGLSSGSLDAGQQQVVDFNFNATGLEPGVKSGNVRIQSNAGADKILPVDLTILPSTYDIVFEVTNTEQQPLTGAQIIFDGEEVPEGQLLIENLVAGTYPYQVIKDGFYTSEGYAVIKDEDLQLTVTMFAHDHDYVSLQVEVLDEFGDSVEDAFVQIQTFGGKLTNQEGVADFSMLAGEYSVSVQKTGMTKHLQEIEVESIEGQVFQMTVPYQRFDVTVTGFPENGGHVSGVGEHYWGQTAHLEADPADGYQLLYWKKDGYAYPSDNQLSWEVTESEHVEAIFAVKYFDIMTSYSGSGSITPSEGAISNSGLYRIIKDSGVVFEIEPDEGYYIEDVIVDGVSLGPLDSYTFESVENHHTFEVVFAVYTFCITVESLENGKIVPYSGTIGPDGTIEVEYGSHQSLLMIPDDGYVTQDVLVDGESVGPQDVYVFQDVTEDHHIDAVFELATGSGLELTQSDLLVYPNPANEFVFVEANEVIRQIEIWGVKGEKLISHQVDSHRTQVDVSNLDAGTYFLSITFNNGQSKSVKINTQR